MARALKSRLENPAVLASIIGGAAAVGVALAGGISGIIGGYFQNETEAAKRRTAIILELIKAHDPNEFKNNVRVMLQSGILTDPDKKICTVVLKGDC